MVIYEESKTQYKSDYPMIITAEIRAIDGNCCDYEAFQDVIIKTESRDSSPMLKKHPKRKSHGGALFGRHGVVRRQKGAFAFRRRDPAGGHSPGIGPLAGGIAFGRARGLRG